MVKEGIDNGHNDKNGSAAAPGGAARGLHQNLSERQMESCVVGLATAGGAIGGASSGGSGILPGAAIGTGLSMLTCEQGKEAPAPRQKRACRQ